jgi:transposase-like protein
MEKRIIRILCAKCRSGNISKNGHNPGAQRYVCRECGVTFSEKPLKFSREIKKEAIEMVLNGIGIRKTAEFVKSSPASVINWLKETHTILKAVRKEERIPETPDIPDIIEFDGIYTFVEKNGSRQ